MPKVIKNLKENILISAKEELFKNGFKNFNMRSLAKKNNTAVGTIYNYFPSKDMLVAMIVLEDWNKTLNNIKEVSNTAFSIEEGLRQFLENIHSFYELYRDIFRSSGISNIHLSYPDKYELMIQKVKEEVSHLLLRFNVTCTDFEVSFIVTNFFTSVTNNWPYEQVVHTIMKIIKEK